MSKTGQWVFEMQEDSEILTRDEFIEKHGVNQVSVWDEKFQELQSEGFSSEEINQMYMQKGI
jgi:hypothetical protein